MKRFKILFFFLALALVSHSQTFIANTTGVPGLIANANNGTVGFIMNNIPPPPPDADVKKYIDSTGITNTGLKTAINNLVVSLKANGLWTNIFAMYPCITDQTVNANALAQMKWNLRNPTNTDGAYRLLYTGTITADSSGMQGDGATGFADTRMKPSALSTTGNSMGYYSETNQSRFEMDMGAKDFSGGSLYFYLTASNANENFGDPNDPDNTVAVGSTKGMFIGTRTTAAATAEYQNGSSISTNTLASGTLGPNNNIYLLARNNGGLEQASTKKFAFFFIYNVGLSSGDASTLSGIINTFQSDVETAQSMPAGTRKAY